MCFLMNLNDEKKIVFMIYDWFIEILRFLYMCFWKNLICGELNFLFLECKRELC